MLELGCGTGEIARRLAPSVERVDAVDPSRAMIQVGERLPGGDEENLNWIPASAETFDYPVQYALIVVARSIHWMDWEQVFPMMRQALTANGRLAIVDSLSDRGGWDEAALSAIIGRYSTNQDFLRLDLFGELEKRQLFDLEERVATVPVTMEQSIDSYIEFYHSTSTLGRGVMGEESAARFDKEMRAAFEPHARLSFEVTVEVAWGQPRARSA